MFKAISSTYTSNFDELTELVSEDILETYSQKTALQFDDLFKIGDNLEYYKWIIRRFRSCRHIFSSALLYEQSDFLLERSMPNLNYYLLYYSWFHSVCSILCLSPELSFGKSKNIRHRNAIELIKQYFVDKGILDETFTKLHNELLMYREAFSYQIPLGGGRNSIKTIPKPEDLFDNISVYLPALIQLSSLLSYCAYEIAEKYSSFYHFDDFYLENQMECDQLFFESISIKDRLNEHLIIDDNDYRMLASMFRYFKGQYPLNLVLFEKFFDDLEGYDRKHQDSFDVRNVLNRIGRWIG